MIESVFQARTLRKLKRLFPGIVILKNDPQYQQGMLDFTLLYNDTWGMLEFKASENAPHRPNQDYFVTMFAGMSFAAFIYPENEEEVLDALQEAFSSRGAARVSQS